MEMLGTHLLPEGGMPVFSLWRTVRVFVSSTFRDMSAERDHLVRFVFPRLREELSTKSSCHSAWR